MTFYLYRADRTNGTFSRNPKFSYFIYGNNAEQNVLDLYGVNSSRNVHMYRTIKPLKLLDMSKVDTIKYLLSEATPQERRALEESFPLKSNRVIRNSETTRDAIVSGLICRLGEYDGYNAPEMKKSLNGGVFHREIMVCDPKDKLELLKSNKVSTAPPPMKGKHGKKPREETHPHSPVKMGFNNFSTPPHSPIKISF